jgi:capsular exopolysaccharide synthesis family protein
MAHADDNRAEMPTHSPGRLVLGPQPPENLPVPTDPTRWGTVHTAAPALPPALSVKPNPVALLQALRTRWLLATGLGSLAATVMSVAVWFLVPVNYTARFVLFISSKPPFILKENPRDDFATYQRTQAALVRQPFVLNAALRNPRVSELSLVQKHSDPIEWLETALTVDFAQSPELMRINLTSEKPQELIILLNAIVNAYLEEVVSDDQRDKLDRLSKLKDISSKYEESLRLKRQQYKHLAQAAGATNSFGAIIQQQFQQERLATKFHDLMAVQRELLHLRLQINADLARKKADANFVAISEFEVNKVLTQDKTLAAYEADIEQLEAGREAAAAAYQRGLKDPRIRQRYDDKIEALKQARARHTEKQRQSIIANLRENRAILAHEAIQREQERIALLQEAEGILRAEITKPKEELNKAIGLAVEVESAHDDAEKLDEVARQLRQLVEGYQVDLLAQQRVRKRQAGEVADVRVNQAERRQIMLAGGAGVVVLSLILVLIAYWEFNARRIQTAEDVVFGLGWRLVGALPGRKRCRLRRGGNDQGYGNSLLTESVDATRTLLLHTARAEGLRTIMVTSAVAREGKTSLSCHLAASLARAGRKTLLVDCDLRSPAVHRLFEVPVEPGFSDLLRGTAQVPDVIRSTPADNLWVVTAGAFDAPTLQALDQDGVPAILARLKEQFDFVVLDSSPVLPVADALVIGQHVDVLIFSLLRGVSRLPNVYAAYQRLRTLGIRMLGAVVNGVQDDVTGYWYRYAHKNSVANRLANGVD